MAPGSLALTEFDSQKVKHPFTNASASFVAMQCLTAFGNPSHKILVTQRPMGLRVEAARDRGQVPMQNRVQFRYYMVTAVLGLDGAPEKKPG